MTISQNCITLIKKFEGFRPKTYLDSVGIPTIGYGSTFWTDNSRVKLGQEISMQNAEKLVIYYLANTAHFIPEVNQNQFDALCSFMYNIGVSAFRKSTLLKKVTKNPNDPSIRDEFMLWVNGRVRGNMQKIDGLVKRRTAESNLYFTPVEAKNESA